MLGLPELGKDQLDKLWQKNVLTNAVGNEGKQTVVVGDTSTGKSTCINFLLGFPINFEAKGIGTRRPCVITQVHEEGQQTIHFEAQFTKDIRHVVPKTTRVEEIIELVTKANNAKNREFFTCLEGQDHISDAEASDKAFDAEPVYVYMYHDLFKFGIRLIDLPGLTRNNPMPMTIAETYIKPGNVVILVVGKDNAANGGYMELVGAMSKCSQVLVLQNYANSVMQDATAVYAAIDAKFKACDAKLGRLTINFVDVGMPYPKDQSSMELWKRATLPQKDWRGMAATGGLGVQAAMYEHGQKWADYLRDQFPNFFQQGGIRHEDSGTTCWFDAGTLPVLNKVIEFSLASVDDDIEFLQARVKEKILQLERELEDRKDRLENLDNPPEWPLLLIGLAKTVSEWLDTATKIPDTVDDKDFGDAMKTTEEEIIACEKMFKQNQLAVGSKHQLSDIYWFTKEMDAEIRSIVGGSCYFDTKLCCLRSWLRLVDEFTAMLAFAPMGCVTESNKIQAFSRMSTGVGAQQEILNSMVQLVCETNSPLYEGRPAEQQTDTIRSLILTFRIRLEYLAKRDVEKALIYFRKFSNRYIKNFTEKVPCVSEEQIVSDIKRSLHRHIETCFSQTIEGKFERDHRGEVIVDALTSRERVVERSGLCVRTEENSAGLRGPVHWLVPFKAHYLNGQIPWKKLEIDDPDDMDSDRGEKRITVTSVEFLSMEFEWFGEKCYVKDISLGDVNNDLKRFMEVRRQDLELAKVEERTWWVRRLEHSDGTKTEGPHMQGMIEAIKQGGSLQDFSSAGKDDSEKQEATKTNQDHTLVIRHRQPEVTIRKPKEFDVARELKPAKFESKFVNAASAINWKMFELAQTPYNPPHFPYDESGTIVDCEVLKMVKALQGELSNFWAGLWRGLVQRIKSREGLAQDLKHEIEESLNIGGARNVHGPLDMQRIQDNYQRLVYAMLEVITGFQFPDSIKKDTWEELSLDKMQVWPLTGNSAEDYRNLVNDAMASQADDDKSDDSDDGHDDQNESTADSRITKATSVMGDIVFPANASAKLAGEAAWTRLSQEFNFVVCQLGMPLTTVPEVMMARASAGKAILAGELEIITKLTLHRLAMVIGEGTGGIFKQRLLKIFERDVKNATACVIANHGYDDPDKLPPMPHYRLDDGALRSEGTEFVPHFLMKRTSKIIDAMLDQLQRKFLELCPFDFSILNGRLPLIHTTMSREPPGKSPKGWPQKKQTEDDATADLSMLVENALYENETWANTEWHAHSPAGITSTISMGKKGTRLPPLASSDAHFVKLSPELARISYDLLDEVKTAAYIEAWGRLRGDKPLADGLAGASLHSMLLRIHKAACTCAIDYCKPKLKDMMAHVYQEDRLMHHLVQDRSMGAKYWEEGKKKCESDVKETEARLEQARHALQEATAPRGVARRRSSMPARSALNIAPDIDDEGNYEGRDNDDDEEDACSVRCIIILTIIACLGAVFFHFFVAPLNPFGRPP